ARQAEERVVPPASRDLVDRRRRPGRRLGHYREPAGVIEFLADYQHLSLALLAVHDGAGRVQETRCIRGRLVYRVAVAEMPALVSPCMEPWRLERLPHRRATTFDRAGPT